MRQPNYFLLTINPLDRNEVFLEDLERLQKLLGLKLKGSVG